MPLLPKVTEMDDENEGNEVFADQRKFELHIQLSTNEATECEIHVNGCSVLKTADCEDDIISTSNEAKSPTKRLPPILCGNGQSTSTLFVPYTQNRNSLSPASRLHSNCLSNKSDLRRRYSPRRKSEDFLKKSVTTGAETLTRAIDLIEPLVRESFELGKDLTNRLIRGAPTDQHGRSADNNLLQRIDNIRSGAFKAFNELAGRMMTNQRQKPPTEIRVPYISSEASDP